MDQSQTMELQCKWANNKMRYDLNRRRDDTGLQLMQHAILLHWVRIWKQTIVKMN